MLRSFNIVLSFLTYLEGETAKKKDEGRLKVNERDTLCLRLPMSLMYNLIAHMTISAFLKQELRLL